MVYRGYLWLAGSEGKEIETTPMGSIGTTAKIHSLDPSSPKARLGMLRSIGFGSILELNV